MTKQELVVYSSAISREDVSALDHFQTDFDLRSPEQRVVSMMNCGGTIVVVYETQEVKDAL